MKFNLASASEVTFIDLRSDFSQTFDLSPQQSTWLSDNDLGHGQAGNRSGLITARISDALMYVVSTRLQVDLAWAMKAQRATARYSSACYGQGRLNVGQEIHTDLCPDRRGNMLF